jgi:ribose transport system substrate-binding protein
MVELNCEDGEPEISGQTDTKGVGRRVVLSASAALAVTAYLEGLRPAYAKDYTFAAALGWTTYDSGRHVQNGYKDAVAKLGGKLTVSDAGSDAKRQSDQIDALVSSKPNALFITPTDAAAIAPAVSRALQAGIPVFAGDSMVPGVAVNSTVLSNNFGMGYYTAEFMAKRLKGKGAVAAVTLPQNESWDQRTLGMQYAFSRYPDIKVVGSWAFAPTAATTPRQAVDNLLTAHPDLNAVWCAWDGAAIEGALAVKAAKKPEIFLTGIDGGKQAFEYIKAGTSMVLTMAQSFYEMTYMDVLFAHQLLAGKKVPRLVISPTYAVTKETLANLSSLPDTYDVPGEAEKLGWTRAL